MLLHKLLQHVLLLLLLTRRFPLPLHLLIVHHLLHHPPRLSIQIAQLRVLRLDLRDVDLRRAGHDVGPPFRLVLLVEVDGDFFTRGSGFQGPGAFIR